MFIFGYDYSMYSSFPNLFNKFNFPKIVNAADQNEGFYNKNYKYKLYSYLK